MNKGYDGTTAATVTLSDNRVAGDVLTPAVRHAGSGHAAGVKAAYTHPGERQAPGDWRGYEPIGGRAVA